VFAAWGVVLAVLTLVQFAFMSNPWAYGLLGGAAIFSLLLALALRRRRAAERDVRELPEVSYPVVLLALGLAAAFLGISFGPWIAAIGGLLVLVGLAGLVHELGRPR
jgi:prepilin signal peptidase PulO-like enzyme (type II secretory pathway)